MTYLGEGVDIPMGTTLVLRTPNPGAQLEPQIQDSVLELSGGSTVVVRHDLRQSWTARRLCKTARREQDQDGTRKTNPTTHVVSLV
jgi:hypothetical protein